VNRAGFVIHSAIHSARADAACIVHLHTVAGTAVSAQAAGLLPISPQAMSLHGSIGYHDFEGVTVREDEQARIVASLGSHRALFFRNHGTLTVGRSVAEAYDRMYMLERACRIQVAALSGGGALVQPPPEVCEAVAPQLAVIADIPRMTWAALLRRLERTEPGYRD
jgi:ribulose-5-phosphate 4-epimerase/fuculose-1-phosphate aldolase